MNSTFRFEQLEPVIAPQESWFCTSETVGGFFARLAVTVIPIAGPVSAAAYCFWYLQ